MGDGDLDYSRLLGVLKGKEYQGLAVLEIPSEEAVFDNFQESVEYLNSGVGN